MEIKVDVPTVAATVATSSPLWATTLPAIFNVVISLLGILYLVLQIYLKFIVIGKVKREIEDDKRGDGFADDVITDQINS